MKTQITRRLATIALGAAIATPVAGLVQQAQAAPSSHGPATIQTIDWRGRSRRGNRHNIRLNFTGRAVTNISGDRFTLRTDSGRTLEVIVRQSGQARKVSRGDRVTVAGYMRKGNIFDAEDLNFIRNRR